LGIALALPHPDNMEKEKEFEKEFNVLHNNKEQEKKAADQLAKEEKEIEEQNSNPNGHFKEKLNQWSDLDKETFLREKTGLKTEARMIYPTGLLWDPNTKNTPAEKAMLEANFRKLKARGDLPDSYSAKDDGLVTDARSQGSCGSCAAFMTGGAMEICLAKAGASLTDLNVSEQQLVDCAYDGSTALGCDGAYPSAYPNYIAGKSYNHENNYAYLGTSPNLECQDVDYWSAGATIDTSYVEYSCDEDKIKTYIYNYGHSIMAIYASDDDFTNYASGVFDTCSSTSINHAVLAVGWGTEDGVDYWLVKNSWGSSWGDSGFFKLKRGTCGDSTVCGALECSASGSADDVPETTSTGTEASSCDLTGWFGQITGTYNLEITSGSTTYATTCTCAHGFCTPNDSSGDACTAICGATTCG